MIQRGEGGRKLKESYLETIENDLRALINELEGGVEVEQMPEITHRQIIAFANLKCTILEEYNDSLKFITQKNPEKYRSFQQMIEAGITLVKEDKEDKEDGVTLLESLDKWQELDIIEKDFFKSDVAYRQAVRDCIPRLEVASNQLRTSCDDKLGKRGDYLAQLAPLKKMLTNIEILNKAYQNQKNAFASLYIRFLPTLADSSHSPSFRLEVPAVTTTAGVATGSASRAYRVGVPAATTTAGAATGAFVGWIVGGLFAIPTFGISLIVGPILGGVIGGLVGLWGGIKIIGPDVPHVRLTSEPSSLEESKSEQIEGSSFTPGGSTRCIFPNTGGASRTTDRVSEQKEIPKVTVEEPKKISPENLVDSNKLRF